jgi:hypothetical protein
MPEEMILILVKENDIYIEVYSGSEDELLSIKESIKNLFDTKEVKELRVSTEEYIACKDDMVKLQELYSR